MPWKIGLEIACLIISGREQFFHLDDALRLYLLAPRVSAIGEEEECWWEIGCFVFTADGRVCSDEEEQTQQEESQPKTRQFFHLDDALRLYLLHTSSDGNEQWVPYDDGQQQRAFPGEECAMLRDCSSLGEEV